MATETLVRAPTDDEAALMALSLRDKGINVTREFWMTPWELGSRMLALVSPDADGPGGYNLHPKIFEALGASAPGGPAFMATRTMVFGEREIEKQLSQIRSGYGRLSEIGPYENVQIVPIPPASEIRKNGFLHLRPLASSTDSELLCELSFAPFGPGGPVPTRNIKDNEELDRIFQALNVRPEDRKQAEDELKRGRASSTLLVNIGLDTLFGLKLV
jgi:hypothetical protein